jgi:hypothetical protein
MQMRGEGSDGQRKRVSEPNAPAYGGAIGFFSRLSLDRMTSLAAEPH